MKFVSRWVVLSLAVIVASNVVPGVELVGSGYLGAVFCALVLALLNATIKPILQLLTLPITIITLGIANLVLNALILQTAGQWAISLFSSGITFATLLSAVGASIIISLISGILTELID